MWSNDAVADEHPDDASPWTRDDWVPDSAVPDAAVFADGARRPPGPGRPAPGFDEPPPEDFDDHDAGVRSARSSLGRKVVAGGIASALLIGSAGALLRNDGEGDAAPATTSATTSATAPATTSFADPALDDTDVPRDSVPPTSVQTVTVPAPVGGVVDVRDPIQPFVAGEPPAWAERQVAIPENLASMAPTEVITLSQSGIV
ncbi:MAG TPA: hypothetical protein VLN74_02940, partial [Ilumatobacteraceae bacterium]|nr:hypothetical protein [Ilumatobacteraceae bacterium]